MDELDLITKLLPDARPPSAEVVARARTRLSLARPVHRPRARTRVRHGRPWRLTAGAALATAGVVIAIVALVSRTTSAPAPLPLQPPHGDQALLRLADQVQALPAEKGGAYWRRSMVNAGLIRVRAGKADFNVLSLARTDRWQPSDTEKPVYTEARAMSFRPATPADERAWRAAGAPAQVDRVCPSAGLMRSDLPGEPEPCSPVTFKASPPDCRYTTAVEHSGVIAGQGLSGLVAGKVLGELTLADLAALPADPDGLRERLRELHKLRPDKEIERSFEELLPHAAALLELPVTPQVRAAVLRLLAGQPATKVYGQTVDPYGRKGIAVTFVKSGGFTSVFGKEDELPTYYRLILDPQTGEALAELGYAGRATAGLTKDAMMDYTALASSSGWTDVPPAPPRDCKLK